MNPYRAMNESNRWLLIVLIIILLCLILDVLAYKAQAQDWVQSLHQPNHGYVTEDGQLTLHVQAGANFASSKLRSPKSPAAKATTPRLPKTTTKKPLLNLVRGGTYAVYKPRYGANEPRLPKVKP